MLLITYINMLAENEVENLKPKASCRVSIYNIDFFWKTEIKNKSSFLIWLKLFSNMLLINA